MWDWYDISKVLSESGRDEYQAGVEPAAYAESSDATTAGSVNSLSREVGITEKISPKMEEGRIKSEAKLARLSRADWCAGMEMLSVDCWLKVGRLWTYFWRFLTSGAPRTTAEMVRTARMFVNCILSGLLRTAWTQRVDVS